MLSCGNPGRILRATVAVWLSVCAAAEAQQTARARYEFAVEREAAVRELLANESGRMPASQLGTQVSQALTAFESVVRPYQRGA